MADIVVITAIGVLFVPLMLVGSFWITDRTGSDFLGFFFLLVMALVLFPLVLYVLIQ